MIHLLQTEQVRELLNAFDISWDIPRLTGDPYINYVIDCLMDEEAPYDAELYRAEIEASNKISRREL